MKSFTYMPIADDPRQKWLIWIARAAWVTCVLGAYLPFLVHIAFLPLALLSLLLFQWQLRWELATERVIAEQKIAVRCRGGIPTWEEVYAMLDTAREFEVEPSAQYTIIIDNSLKSSAFIPAGNWDLSDTTLCGSPSESITVADGVSFASLREFRGTITMGGASRPFPSLRQPGEE